MTRAYLLSLSSLSSLSSLLLLLAAQGAGAESVDLARPIEAGGAVRIDIYYGSIRVIAGEPGRVRVTGTIGDGLQRVTLRRDAGALEVRVRWPLWSRIRRLWRDGQLHGHLYGHLYDADLEIEVPAETRLFLVSRDARVEIDGLEGPIGVGVVSSDVTIRGQPRLLSVETVSGSLDFEGRTSDLDASTMSGSLRAVGVEGQVRCDAVTGSVEVVGERISAATLTTVSGGVTFGGAVEAGGKVEIETSSGDVTLGCCAAQGIEVDLVTRDGEIIDELSEAEPIRDSLGQRRLQAVLAGGGGLVQVRTRSGSIRLMRQSPLSTP